MAPLIDDVTNKYLVPAFDNAAAAGQEIELMDTFSKFIMDILASCMLGVDAQSFNAGNSDVLSALKAFFVRTPWDYVKVFLLLMPGVSRLSRWCLGLSVFKMRPTRKIFDMIQGAIHHRMRTNVRRSDLIDLAMVDAMKEKKKKGIRYREIRENAPLRPKSPFAATTSWTCPSWRPLSAPA